MAEIDAGRTDFQVPEFKSEPAVAPEVGPEIETEPLAPAREFSFLQDGNAVSFWRKPLVRLSLVLLSLVLLLTLLLQIVIHERDRLVAFQPGLKPGLQLLCGPFNCSLSPLRRIESMVIDSSSFSRIRGDSYRLNFTVKNVAAFALAVPAIELTLTDTLDQPTVRRVFLPSELGIRSNNLAAGSEWSTSFAIAVKTGTSPEPVVGYRLLAFYP